MMLCNSCRSSKIEKTIYYVPVIEFPEFPLIDEYVISNDGKQVTVNAEFFRKLLIFKTQYKSAVLEYENKKELYSGGNKDE